MTSRQRVAVIGAGAWGTALAGVAARAGRNVTLIARDAATARDVATRRESPHLPGFTIDAAIAVSHSMADAARADVVLVAVPAQAVRAVIGALKHHLTSDLVTVICAKGIERGTGRFMTEIVDDIMITGHAAILSGPSFAADVARGLPTAVTIATADEAVAIDLCRALGSKTFRPYHSTDVRGVEIGGAAKNVLAIAAGIVAGRGLGASAAAALTTRGFAELTRFGRACGAEPETLTGLSGLGDLILTCSSAQSRNFSLGLAIGRNEPRGDKLAEGVFTAAVLRDMAIAKGVDMPIVAAVTAVLDGTLEVDRAIEGLLTRPFKAEG